MYKSNVATVDEIILVTNTKKFGISGTYIRYFIILADAIYALG